MAYSPDGRTLVAGSFDGSVRLWNVASRKLRGLLPTASSKSVVSVAFSPDGNTLAAGGEDGRVHLWSGYSWPDFAALKKQVCGMVGGDLSRAEWAQYAPAIAYRASC